VQTFLPAEQVHGRKQSNEPEEMIAMQMAYKYMINADKPDMIPTELNLCAFATINKEEFFVVVDQLR